MEPYVTEAAEQRRLIGLAYRLLGSVSEAEDAVQEAWTRWYTLSDQQRDAIASPIGWLVTTTSRICLDTLGSARVRRERYTGPWLPEPVSDPARWSSYADGGFRHDPAAQVTDDEEITMALLVVLESMTPAERVAFILHDVFQYTFNEIAAIVDRSPQACRQLASSARRRVRASRPHSASVEQHAEVVEAFKSAWETGDLTTLVTLLDPNAIAIADGGGRVRAGLEPVRSAQAIAKLILEVRERYPDVTVTTTNVNGQTGIIARSSDQTLAVISLAVTNRGTIQRMWVVRNPEKLRSWH
jgi:RNA polymerase sigma-70 factor (ECF subfamily)